MLASSSLSPAAPFPTRRPILPCRAPSMSIFDRRSSRQRSGSDAHRNICLQDGTSFDPVSNSHRPTNCGFLPLPSIIASPVCTPTTSISSRALGLDSESEEDKDVSSASTGDFTTAPSTPSDELSPRLILSPPTWISTPPTPPQKLVRRSATCTTRRPSSPLVSPSASFPASMSPHAQSSPRYPPKRRASVPPMSSRPRASSDSSATLKRHRTGLARQEAKLTASPLRATLFPFVAAPDATTPVIEFSAAHPKPLFHIAPQVGTDIEDSGRHPVESPERSNDETSIDGSSGHSLDDNRCREKKKDNVRKYHALMELLTTEVGYLLDLRALVTIYLRYLPTLTCRTPSSSSSFSRSPPSFTSNLVTHFHPHALASSVTLADGHAKEKDKGLSRYLFTDAEIVLLTRNAEEVLQLHEHFVQELEAVVTPLGFSMLFHEAASYMVMQKEAEIESVDAAIGAVSTKFATEASRFNSYQAFCTGHPEALTLVRRVQQQYPIEWEAFEQLCSALVSDMLEAHIQLGNGKAGVQVSHPASHQGRDTAPSPVVASKERKRTPSLTSTDVAVRSLRSRANGGSKDFLLPSDARKDNGSRRLAFMDYMIKPVQRICKYPLLLDQLKPGKSVRALSVSHPIVRSDVNVVVESAIQAMRHVASSVDEARHRQDVAIQSSLIVSRISLATPVSGSSYLSSVHPAFQTLTPTFLSSLGTCLLAGSLDVMHYESFKASSISPNINAKYLGAFLYMGGYFILVKVYKGKVYEPRHWFSLADFDIIDVTEDDAMLPCSFRLSCTGHQFELAAACRREKDAWMSAIQECLQHFPQWTNEPTSSLQFDGKGELIPSALDDGPFEAINALPTIQSIPELASNGDYPELTESLLAAFQTDTKQSKKSKHDMPFKPDVPVPPSRRSSTASVKAIFSPMSADSDTIVIRRSSSIARSQVDQGLHDVISEPCLTARSLASSREEELFQAPKITRSGFARSNSGLSMAGMTKNRLRRHESVRVPRRKSLLDRPEGMPANGPISRRTSLANKRHTKKLSITSTSDGEGNLFVPDSDPSSYSPSPFFHSSLTTSSPNSSLPSPTRDPTVFPPYPGLVPEADSPQKGTRSLVDNVRGLFLSRQTSPVSPGSIPDVEQQWKQTLTPGLLKRWAKAPLHRRARSAPEVPKYAVSTPTVRTDTTNVVVPGGSSVRPDLNFEAALSSSRSTEVVVPARRRSLLPTSMSRYTAKTDITPPAVQNNFPLLQRLKAIDIV